MQFIIQERQTMGDQTSIKFLELANGCACEALDRPIKKIRRNT